jgi:hypothetical protein
MFEQFVVSYKSFANFTVLVSVNVVLNFSVKQHVTVACLAPS